MQTRVLSYLDKILVWPLDHSRIVREFYWRSSEISGKFAKKNTRKYQKVKVNLILLKIKKNLNEIFLSIYRGEYLTSLTQELKNDEVEQRSKKILVKISIYLIKL